MDESLRPVARAAASPIRVWLIRGVVAGLILAVVEVPFAALTGLGIPWTYLAFVLLCNSVFGAGIGVIAGWLARYRELPLDEFPWAFTLLGAATFLTFFLAKASHAAEYRDLPRALGVGALLCVVLAGFPLALGVIRRASRTSHAGVSLAVSLLLLDLWLVAGRHVTREAFSSYASPAARLANVAFLLLLLGGLLTQDRLLASERPRIPQRPEPILAATLVAVSVITGLAWALARHPRSEERPVSLGTSLPSPARPGVVLITIDTLRADRLSVYGYERLTTPNLAAFAREAVLYENARSPSSWTLPAHASLLTGTLPRRHGAHYPEIDAEQARSLPRRGARFRPPPIRPLSERNTTLAEVLARAGYETGAVVANALYLDHRLGIAQGFQQYDDRPGKHFGYEPVANSLLRLAPQLYFAVDTGYRLAEDINRSAFTWLEAHHRRPFFLFVNYMEPHRPYVPPSPYDTLFPGKSLFVDEPAEAIRSQARGLTARESLHFHSQYDGEIAYVDHEIGLLFRKLRQLGVYDESMIVVTSDHGEFFGEHSMWGHNYGPYEEVYRVPLIVKYPGAQPRGVEREWVQITDVFPTVLEVLGLPQPAHIDARPLSDMDHLQVAEQYVEQGMAALFGERFSRGYQVLYEEPWKLVAYTDESVQLFDLKTDPGERVDLSGGYHDRVRGMRNRLEQYVMSIPSRHPQGEVLRSLDDEGRLRQLRTLGYVQ